jgi:hydrogenase nickel incorporation protein HypB
MHELSIAHAVVRTVVDALPEPAARVTAVRLRIGELSGVVAQALEFAFDVAAAGSPLAEARLVVERAPVVIDCPTCGHQPLADLRSFTCPRCGQPCGVVVGGRELEIVDVELLDAEVPARGPRATPAAMAAPGSAAVPEALRAGVLAKNDLLAEGLRGWFTSSGVRVSNWVSSPGSGKTALLEAVLAAAAQRGLRPAALVGDCATDNDARRLARSGALVRQVVTDGVCHLEADMVSAHLDGWDLAEIDLLAIENVGNLVCPTGFDLGEDLRVALLSVTEGEDKPLKYPQTFHRADVVVVTKVDLAEAVEWDRAGTLSAIRAVNPDAAVIETSARTGQGVPLLLDVLLGASALIPDAPHLQEAT